MTAARCMEIAANVSGVNCARAIHWITPNSRQSSSPQLFASSLNVPGNSVCSVRSQKRLEIGGDPCIGFSLAVDGPIQHGTAHNRLNCEGEACDGTSTELAGADSFLEQRAKLCAKLASVGQREPVKIRVGEVHFEEREMIRHRFRSSCHLRHAAGDGFNRA